MHEVVQDDGFGQIGEAGGKAALGNVESTVECDVGGRGYNGRLAGLGRVVEVEPNAGAGHAHAGGVKHRHAAVLDGFD